jgi:hypothetical protein
MDILEITDIAQFDEYAKHLADISWFEDKQITFADSIKGLQIHLIGEQFNSSITTGIMRAILKLQTAVYENYSIYRYGCIKRLSTDDRFILELCVKVLPGSSWLEIDVADILKAIAKRISAMTYKQFMGTVAVVAIGCLVRLGINKIADYKTKVAELEVQRAAATDMQKIVVEAQIATIEAQTEFYRAISKQDLTMLEINGEAVDTELLKEITKTTREKHPLSTVIISGDFIITDIHIEEDAIYIDVVEQKKTTLLRYVNILKDLISTDDYQWFKDCTNRSAIQMTIITTQKKGEIISAYLQSFTKQPDSDKRE